MIARYTDLCICILAICTWKLVQERGGGHVHYRRPRQNMSRSPAGVSCVSLNRAPAAFLKRGKGGVQFMGQQESQIKNDTDEKRGPRCMRESGQLQRDKLRKNAQCGFH